MHGATGSGSVQSISRALSGVTVMFRSRCMELFSLRCEVSCGDDTNVVVFRTMCFVFQSCVASRHLEDLVIRAHTDPTTSQQAALWQQMRALRENDVSTNAARGPTARAVRSVLGETSVVSSVLSLEIACKLFATCVSCYVAFFERFLHQRPSLRFQAWQRLLISSNHLDLLRELPPYFNVVVLQHNENRFEIRVSNERVACNRAPKYSCVWQ